MWTSTGRLILVTPRAQTSPCNSCQLRTGISGKTLPKKGQSDLLRCFECYVSKRRISLCRIRPQGSKSSDILWGAEETQLPGCVTNAAM